MLRRVFSTASVALVTLALSVLVALEGRELLGDFMSFQSILIAILCASAITIAFSAFASFDIETKNAFVLDIIVDVIVLCITVGGLTWILTVHNVRANIDAESVYLGMAAVGLALIDFLISLNGGAGKLLEMDREHFSRG